MLWGAVWGQGELGGLGSPQTKSKLNNQTKLNQAKPHQMQPTKPEVSHMHLHLIKPNKNWAAKPNHTILNQTQWKEIFQTKLYSTKQNKTNQTKLKPTKTTHTKPNSSKSFKGFEMSKSAAQLLYGPVLVLQENDY